MTFLADPMLLAVMFGAIVGLILALTGAGGGIIAVPLLVFGLHLPIQQAAPIGLLAVGLAAALGAFMGWRQGILRYRAALLIGLTGLCSAPLGVWLAGKLPQAPLLALFALILGWTALQFFRRARQPTGETRPDTRTTPCQLNPNVGRFDWTLPCARALTGTGLLSGLLSGLLGVGGGFVIVPALTRHSDLSAKSILATSLGVIALVAIGAVSTAALSGMISWPVALPFASGAIAGLLAGRLLASRITGNRLQQAFATLCLLVALLMLARAAGLV